MRIVCCALAVFVMATGPQAVTFAENDFTLKIEDKAPPEEIDAQVREKIIAKSYQLSDADGLFFEMWFVPELEVSAIAGTTKDTLDNVEEVALLGAMIVHREKHLDFREDPIDPGTYVLRLALQPQDGDHMGTSPYDTFAILVPHAKDAELREFIDPETMVDLASENTIAEHPAILALQPMESDEGEFPRLGVNEEEEWHFLCLKFPAHAGDETTELALRLVFEGLGEL